MIKALSTLLLAGLIFKLDKSLLKKAIKSSKKDKILHVIFAVIALSLTLLYLFDVSLPNPTEAIKWIYEPLAKPLKHLLESYL